MRKNGQNRRGDAVQETPQKNDYVTGIENELTVQITDGLMFACAVSASSTANMELRHAQPFRERPATIDLSGLPVKNRCPTVERRPLESHYSVRWRGPAARIVIDVNDNYVSKNLDTYFDRACRTRRSRRT